MNAPSVRWGGRGTAALRRRDFDLRLDPSAGTLTGRCAANPFSLDTALRVAMTALLLRESGALIHGAGLILGRDAVLCPGKSGAGKSTLSRKAGAERVLSDELTAVHLEPRGVSVSGTPFQGEFQTGGINRTLPLRALFFLRRGQNPSCRPLTPAGACVRLLRCCLFFDRSFGQMGQLLGLARSICERVPAFDFAFSLGESWKEIAARMREVTPTRSASAARPGAGRRSGSGRSRGDRRRSGS